MNEIKRLSNKFIKTLWFGIASLVVILAVLLSVMRLLLPHLTNYNQDISDYLTQNYDINLQFGHIMASWSGNGPSLTLVDIEFTQQESDAIDIDVANLHIEIDFWRSVLGREIVAHNFILDGVVLNVNTQTLLANETTTSPATDSDVFDSISPLLLKHIKRFDVKNSRLNVIKPNGTLTKLNIEQLTWLNKDNRHQAVGAFTFSTLDAESIEFVLDLEGEHVDHLAGQFYLNSKGINFASFLAAWSDDAVSHISSHLPFEVWLNIENSQATTLVGKIQDPILHAHLPNANRLSWVSDNQEHYLKVDRGLLFGKITPNETQWQIKQLTINDGSTTTSEINLQAATSLTEGMALETQDIAIKPLLTLANLFSLPAQAQSWLANLNPQSQLADLTLKVDAEKQFTATGNIANLGWEAVDSIPGIHQLNIDWAINNQQFSAHVFAENTQLGFPNLYDRAFNLTEIDFFTAAYWQQSDIQGKADWRVNINDLTAVLPQTSVAAEVSLFPDEQGELTMQMYAETTYMEAQSVEAFLPRHAMGQSVYDYVVDAFLGGGVEYGRALWQGSFAQFPYQDKEGMFHADLQIEEGVFKFQPDWPEASDLSLTLSFINDGLFFHSISAKLINAQLVKLDASIADLLGDAELNLSADIKSLGPDVTEVMLKSMLRNSVGKALEEIQISDWIEAKLDLTVPLVTDDEISATGHVKFDDNKVLIRAPGFNLAQVTGILNFDMDEVSADKLSFVWGAAPFDAKVHRKITPEGYYKVILDLSSQWQADDLLKKYHFNYLSDRVEGHVDWQGELVITIPDAGFEYEFTGDFDLTETQLDLPHPYFKIAGEAEVLNISASGNEDRTLVHAHINNNLTFDGVLPYDRMSFSRAYLVLGEEQLGLPGQGFNIALHQAEIILDEYIDFVTDLTDDLNALPVPESTDATLPILGKPNRIRGHVDKMFLGPLVWSDTQFNIKSKANNWLVNVASNEFRGDINIAEDWHGQGVNIEADYFNITLQENEKLKDEPMLNIGQVTELSQSIFANTPPIDMLCQRCEWQTKPLGSIDLSLSRINGELSLNKFILQHKKNALNAKGVWRLNKGTTETTVSGKVNSDNVAAWANDLDLKSPLKDSDLEGDFELNWQGAPYELNTQTLAGNLSWKLGEGSISEVSDKGARLLSVLSLDSLVRKLKLDFRDVFNKGLFFNEMTGTMAIEKGVVKTDDTFMDGLAGNMDIKGQTDLTTKKVNYNISFAPKVTSSIPIIIAWMVNPVTGVAALAIDKALESAEVISKLEFKVTGTIDNPVMDETGRSSREVQLSTGDEVNKPSETHLNNTPHSEYDGTQVEPQFDAIPVEVLNNTVQKAA